MGETTGQIENHIRSKRDDLSANLSELERKVKSAVNWREYYKDNSGAFLAAAVGVGLAISLAAGQRKRGDIPAGSSEAPRHTAGGSSAAGPLQQHIGDIKTALIGVAATQAKTFLSKLVPGFEEQLSQKGMPSGSRGPDAVSY